MTLVTFRADVFPHCKNDVVDLDKAELKRVDAIAKLNHVEDPYVKGNDPDVEPVADPRERDQKVATAEAEAAEARAEEQQAVTNTQAALEGEAARGPATSANSSVGEAEAKAEQAKSDADAAKEAEKAAEAAKAEKAKASK